MPGDVEKVVDWVVDEVAAEAGDAESGAVAAPAGAFPLAAGHTVEIRRQLVGGGAQRAATVAGSCSM